LIAGALAVPTVADESCLGCRLLKRSSLVSSPVFFDFGEPIADPIPSLNVDVILILSAQVEYFRGCVNSTDPGNSILAEDASTSLPTDVEREVEL